MSWLQHVKYKSPQGLDNDLNNYLVHLITEIIGFLIT